MPTSEPPASPTATSLSGSEKNKSERVSHPYKNHTYISIYYNLLKNDASALRDSNPISKNYFQNKFTIILNSLARTRFFPQRAAMPNCQT